jgi:hypothetical protein
VDPSRSRHSHRLPEPRPEIHSLFPSLRGFPPSTHGGVSDTQGSRSLRALENDVQALRLRVEGATFDEIASALGYRTRSAAWKAVYRARTARLLELARLVRQLELVGSQQRLAAIERRIEALNAGVGVRQGRRLASLRVRTR